MAVLNDFAADFERVASIARRTPALIGTCLAEEAPIPELIALLRERRAEGFEW